MIRRVGVRIALAVLCMAVGLIGGTHGLGLDLETGTDGVLGRAGGGELSPVRPPSPTPRATEEKQEAEALSEVVRATLLPARELHGATPPADIAAAIRVYDWPPGEADQVFWCESRWIPTATGRAGERGIAQIARVHIPTIREMGYTWAQMYKVGPNLAVAYRLYQAGATGIGGPGYNWYHWRFSKECHGL